MQLNIKRPAPLLKETGLIGNIFCKMVPILTMAVWDVELKFSAKFEVKNLFK